MLLTRRDLIRQTAAFAATALYPPSLAAGARLIPFSTPAPVVAQELSGDRSIRLYLAARSAELEREFLPGINSAADFERVRPALREDLFDMLWLKPAPERSPLNATVTGKIERPGYTIEKLHFQSLPGLYVTANLYLPNPANGRYPT